MSVGRCLYQILVELGAVFELSHDGLDGLGFAQVNLQPFAVCSFGAPECAVIIVDGIGGLEVFVVI